MRCSLVFLTVITLVTALLEDRREDYPQDPVIERGSLRVGSISENGSTLLARSPARNKGRGKSQSTAKQESKQRNPTSQGQDTAGISSSGQVLADSHATASASEMTSTNASKSPKSKSDAKFDGSPTTPGSVSSPEKGNLDSLHSSRGRRTAASPSSGIATKKNANIRTVSSTETLNRLAPQLSIQEGNPHIQAGTHIAGSRTDPSLLSSSRARTSKSPVKGRNLKSVAESPREPQSPSQRPSRSADPRTPRAGWDPSSTTIHGARTREGGAGGNAAEARTRTPSPVDRSRAQSPSFHLWLECARGMVEGTRSVEGFGQPADSKEVDAAKRSRMNAKNQRAIARSKLAEARKALYQGRASSPTTQNIMVSSSAASGRAVQATKINTDRYRDTATKLALTDHHHKIEGYLKSGAREFRRKFSLEANRDAFWDEYQARLAKEEAEELHPDNPGRGVAYMRAAMAKARAVRHAKDYYKHRDQYIVTKEEFSGSDSSSTDGEQELKDTPRSKVPV